ncbi:MAG: hypothetical protein SGBAC_002874 [Bacillariaceae sp.]
MSYEKASATRSPVNLFLYDLAFHELGDGTYSELRSGEYFAVAINTYKRPDRLRNAVQHYADTCGKKAGVGEVFIIWAEQGATVPAATSFFDSNLRNSEVALENRAYVKVLQKDKDSLNSRFEPIEELNHDAVFMVDDDIRVDCSSLTNGFNAWRQHPWSMVGYYPRLASPPLSDPTSSSLIYHTWPIVYLRHKFNFILTKASFLHAKYLGLYTGDEFPQEARDHVDKHKNCEDIAMSMLVANYTKYKNGSPSYPIYVEGNVEDTGLFGGISTGSGHMVTRSDCLTTLTEIFHGKGWESPLAYEIPLGENSWVHHAPGFQWQSKPSNFFEWISFANILT